MTRAAEKAARHKAAQAYYALRRATVKKREYLKSRDEGNVSTEDASFLFYEEAKSFAKTVAPGLIDAIKRHDELEVRNAALANGLAHTIMFIEHSLHNAVDPSRNIKFKAGVTDLELTPEGNYKLSQARQALADGIGRDGELINELKERMEVLEARNEELVDALTFILPLAKGYAAANRVGSNHELILIAEKVLAENRGTP